MRKIIIILQIITLIFLLSIPEQVDADKFYWMTVTAYSLYLIADKHNDGMTASNTPIKEGVCAINVDCIGGKWLIKSPLKLGDKIYIENLGYFDCLDTGYFTDTNYKQDFWNVDIYIEDYDEAVLFGRQLKKVFVIKD